ncbi:protein EARLY-RESPONSIVE TO DEHYDRATION 7, chloroplastic [Trifolium repens]|nr:protein EARLY-RESPONSIVE TO DEHYDRATION 7, chloroplastic [Trifolium repens]
MLWVKQQSILQIFHYNLPHLVPKLSNKQQQKCEYRNHEIARLNPRDCWYWLSGNCLNLTCALRHPVSKRLCWQA